MIDQQHPITLSPELRKHWAQQAQRLDPRDPIAWLDYVAAKAAQWGADQELEACCEWIHDWYGNGSGVVVRNLRAARRPKPPSLKEQALGAMGRFTVNAHTNADEMNRDFDTIRRALEQLNE
jgi:hypothetical protein